MKVIGTSNYGNESVADVLVCLNVANDYYGNKIVEALNEEEGYYYYKLVPDNYVLWRGMEELI